MWFNVMMSLTSSVSRTGQVSGQVDFLCCPTSALVIEKLVIKQRLANVSLTLTSVFLDLDFTFPPIVQFGNHSPL